MTSPLSYPLIDGFAKSFVSIEGTWAAPSANGASGATGALNLNLKGYKNIEMSRVKTRGIKKGTHPDPLGKTRGSNAYKCSIEMGLEEYSLVQAQLAAIRADYGNVFFSFSRTYTENGTDTITDTALGCTMDSTEGTDEQSDDPTMRKVDLNPLKIKFNGLDDEVPLAPVSQ